MEKEVRCANVRFTGIQRLTDYVAISYRDVQMLIKMNVQTLNDNILKAYELVSPEINEITASVSLYAGQKYYFRPSLSYHFVIHFVIKIFDHLCFVYF